MGKSIKYAIEYEGAGSTSRVYSRKTEKQDTIPFDEALRRLVNTPPKHKTAARPTKGRATPSSKERKK